MPKWQCEPVHDLKNGHLYGFMGDCGTGSPDRSVGSPALAAPPETARVAIPVLGCLSHQVSRFLPSIRPMLNAFNVHCAWNVTRGDNCQVTPRPPRSRPPKPQCQNREWQAPHFTAEDWSLSFFFSDHHHRARRHIATDDRQETTTIAHLTLISRPRTNPSSAW
jgi:hypothetical protein